MVQTKNQKEVRIRILKIREVEFSDKEIPDEIENIEFGKNLFYALGFHYAPNLEKRTFALRTHIKYSLKNDPEPIMLLVNEILFEVLGLSEVVKINKNNNQFEINNNFLIPLISVSIGTTRGMMATKTRGKRINDFPLPMLNPLEILEKTRNK